MNCEEWALGHSEICCPGGLQITAMRDCEQHCEVCQSTEVEGSISASWVPPGQCAEQSWPTRSRVPRKQQTLVQISQGQNPPPRCKRRMGVCLQGFCNRGWLPWWPSSQAAGGPCSIPLQGSCLEDSMDRAAWWATVHGVAKRRTRPSHWNFQLHTLNIHSSLQTWRNDWQSMNKWRRRHGAGLQRNSKQSKSILYHPRWPAGHPTSLPLWSFKCLGSKARSRKMWARVWLERGEKPLPASARFLKVNLSRWVGDCPWQSWETQLTFLGFPAQTQIPDDNITQTPNGGGRTLYLISRSYQ